MSAPVIKSSTIKISRYLPVIHVVCNLPVLFFVKLLDSKVSTTTTNIIMYHIYTTISVYFCLYGYITMYDRAKSLFIIIRIQANVRHRPYFHFLAGFAWRSVTINFVWVKNSQVLMIGRFDGGDLRWYSWFTCINSITGVSNGTASESSVTYTQASFTCKDSNRTDSTISLACSTSKGLLLRSVLTLFVGQVHQEQGLI